MKCACVEVGISESISASIAHFICYGRYEYEISVVRTDS